MIAQATTTRETSPDAPAQRQSADVPVPLAWRCQTVPVFGLYGAPEEKLFACNDNRGKHAA
jgi:hypothetical protein